MARVEMHRAAFKAHLAGEGSRGWTDAAERTGVAALQAAAPMETGFLRTRFTAETSVTPDGPRVRFRSNVGDPPYDLFQEVGTGIYGPKGRPIRPRVAKALRWIDKATGDTVFAKQVRGVRPKRFFRDAMLAVFKRVRYYPDGNGPGPDRG